MLIFKKEMIGKATMETFLEMIMGIARARTGGGGMQPQLVFFSEVATERLGGSR